MVPLLAALVLLARMPSELAPLPVTLPVAVMLILPTPLWVTAMPLAAPLSVPEVEIVTFAGATLEPPDELKSSASPLVVVMLAAPVTVKLPAVDDCPVIVPV